jgi:hypothetical protein
MDYSNYPMNDPNSMQPPGGISAPGTDSLPGGISAPGAPPVSTEMPSENQAQNAFNEANNFGGFMRQRFTTLEYAKIENAYTDLEFNNPSLKRAPNAKNVTPFQDITQLNVSTFK